MLITWRSPDYIAVARSYDSRLLASLALFLAFLRGFRTLKRPDRNVRRMRLHSFEYLGPGKHASCTETSLRSLSRVHGWFFTSGLSTSLLLSFPEVTGVQNSRIRHAGSLASYISRSLEFRRCASGLEILEVSLRYVRG